MGWCREISALILAYHPLLSRCIKKHRLCHNCEILTNPLLGILEDEIQEQEIHDRRGGKKTSPKKPVIGFTCLSESKVCYVKEEILQAAL